MFTRDLVTAEFESEVAFKVSEPQVATFERSKFKVQEIWV